MKNTHSPRKRFGQNFLQDNSIINAIIAAINIQPQDNIVEIGPGVGALTKKILQQHGSLTAIEIDRDLIATLEQQCSTLGDFNLINADALDFDFDTLATKAKKLRIIGNLPYNISTPLLFHLLLFREDIIDMHFMLQQEVVNRIAAKVGTKEYGRLSVMVQYHCQAQTLMVVPPTAFYPQPKVTSAVVRLAPYQQLPVVTQNYNLFAAIVAAAFNQRRKVLSNSLGRVLAAEVWQQTTISPSLRAEKLTVADFVELSNLQHNLTQK